MYGTVSMRNMPRITNYRQALEFHDSIKPLRGRSKDSARPIGRRSKRNVKTVRKTANGSVIFRLYYTDVVTYYPDGRVAVQGYRSATTGTFAYKVLPTSLYLYSSSGALLFTKAESDHHGSMFFWTQDLVTGRYRRRTDIIAVRCESGDRVVVRPSPSGRGWIVDNEDDIGGFEWRELDRGAAKRIAKESRLDDFCAWLRAYTALGGALPEPTYRYRYDYDGILELIRDGEFVDALDQLPVTTRGGRWDAALRQWIPNPPRISSSTIDTLRRHAFTEGGATVERQAKTIDYRTWVNRIRRSHY